MSTTSSVPEPHTVLQQSTTTPPSVLSQDVLSPQEIERICKAFIRLITAPEKGEKSNGHTSRSSSSKTRNTNISKA